jgi:WD40 repeat protein
MMMEKALKLLGIFFVVLFGVSCSSGPIKINGSYRVVEIPQDFAARSPTYWWLDWDEQYGLIGFVEIDDEYFYYQPKNQNIQRMAITSEIPCDSYSYLSFQILPDSRLGAVMDCWIATTGISDQISYNIAIDQNSYKAEQLVKGDLPDSRLVGDFDFNDDMSLGVQTIFGLDGTTYWITEDGYSPMDITIEQKEESWNLSEYFGYPEKSGGTARSATISPSGEKIAFFAGIIPDEIEGVAKIGIDFSLYVYTIQTQELEEPISDLKGPFSIIWSPDGTQLAFVSQRGYFSTNNNRVGLYIYGLEKDEWLLLDKGGFSDLVWSPDGDQLAVLVCVEGESSCDGTELRVYDLNTLK